MNASAIEPSDQGRGWGVLVVALLACGWLVGCAEDPLPQPQIRREDCLRGVQMKNLKAAIARCDAVVAAFPNDPFPLNERFLLHTLNQDQKAACRDILRANALARGSRAPATDALLRQDLQLRLASCQPRRTTLQQRSNN
ncbi:MAG: hypothetical protein ACK5QW_06005 [Cyanobacteriota bacterium]